PTLPSFRPLRRAVSLAKKGRSAHHALQPLGSYSSAIAALGGMEPSYPLEILDGIDAGGGRFGEFDDADAETVPQRAQLLERFPLLDRRGFERRVTMQEARAVGIEADMAQHRQAGRQGVAHRRPG